MNFYLGSVLHSAYHRVLAPFMGFWRRNVMPIVIIAVIVIGRMKRWHWKLEKQHSKYQFIHHNSLSETRLSPEKCFIIPSEKVGISPFTLFGTIPTTVGWTWLFVLHNHSWDFIWTGFGWGHVYLHTWSDSALNFLDSFVIVPWWAVMCGTPDNMSFTSRWATGVAAGLTEVQRTEALWSCHIRFQTWHFLCSPCACASNCCYLKA